MPKDHGEVSAHYTRGIAKNRVVRRFKHTAIVQKVLKSASSAIFPQWLLPTSSTLHFVPT